ncbi:hypothetical protein D3C83_168120 [compost metagenome]
MPATIVIGSLMATCIMLGALATHAFILGFEVQGDGGQLVFYAVIVLAACISLLFLHREQLLSIKQMLIK